MLDDFVSADESNALLEWTLTNEVRFAAAQVEQGVVPQARVSRTLRDIGPFTEFFEQRLLAHVACWIEALRLSAFNASTVELELAAHGDGGFFALHSDTYRSDQTARGDRMISTVFYFHSVPAGFSGGALRLHDLAARPGDPGLDIAPLNGRLVVFPSWWPHEVMPVLCPAKRFQDSRFSLNGWIHRARPPPGGSQLDR